jgi:hypothetical protein
MNLYNFFVEEVRILSYQKKNEAYVMEHLYCSIGWSYLNQRSKKSV